MPQAGVYTHIYMCVCVPYCYGGDIDCCWMDIALLLSCYCHHDTDRNHQQVEQDTSPDNYKSVRKLRLRPTTVSESNLGLLGASRHCFRPWTAIYVDLLKLIHHLELNI